MKKQIQSPAYKQHFKDYDSYIKGRDYKGKMYQTAVKEFLIWLENYGIQTMKEVTTKEMLTYYDYLITRPNQRKQGTLAEATIRLHLLSIYIFIDNLLSLNEIQKGFYMPNPKFSGEGKNPRNTLTVDEILTLYQHSENLLEKALLSVAYGCGLRRGELQNLNVNDVQLHSGILVVRSGKNNKSREVPMCDYVLDNVKKYINERQETLREKQIENGFFIGKKSKRMSGENLNKTLKRIIDRTQNITIIDKDITLHCLRHSIAHHLAENNAGIDFIRSFLGHSYINTAYIYAIRNKKQNKRITLI
ncbi:MAG: tyrosine-type recombinase/integrase [Arcicella sp.]|nr:tyrosine-type recombinase/integrase [Arcicella sp.]